MLICMTLFHKSSLILWGFAFPQQLEGLRDKDNVHPVMFWCRDMQQGSVRLLPGQPLSLVADSTGLGGHYWTNDLLEAVTTLARWTGKIHICFDLTCSLFYASVQRRWLHKELFQRQYAHWPFSLMRLDPFPFIPLSANPQLSLDG